MLKFYIFPNGAIVVNPLILTGAYYMKAEVEDFNADVAFVTFFNSKNQVTGAEQIENITYDSVFNMLKVFLEIENSLKLLNYE